MLIYTQRGRHTQEKETQKSLPIQQQTPPTSRAFLSSPLPPLFLSSFITPYQNKGLFVCFLISFILHTQGNTHRNPSQNTEPAPAAGSEGRDPCAFPSATLFFSTHTPSSQFSILIQYAGSVLHSLRLPAARLNLHCCCCRRCCRCCCCRCFFALSFIVIVVLILIILKMESISLRSDQNPSRHHLRSKTPGGGGGGAALKTSGPPPPSHTCITWP
jgi:hypothetical protein